MTDAPSAARDQPLIAIDVVPMSFTSSDGLRVATARRQYDPYAGLEALPGVLLDGAELLADGARRALRTKTGTEAAAVRHLAQIGAFDGPDRDPRSAAISVAFVAVVSPPSAGAATEATAVQSTGPSATAPSATAPSATAPSAIAPSAIWRRPGQGDPRLPFDHDAIIAAAVDHVRTRIWRDLPLTRALLGETFTSSDAARLQSELTGVAPDPGNTNRALRTNPALVRVESPAPAAARGGRPPATWTWAG